MTHHTLPHRSGMRWLAGGLLASSLLTGCVTGGGYPGQYPDQYPGSAGYPGSGYPDAGYPDAGYPGGYANQRLLGTVQDVDPNGGRLTMTAEDGRYGSSRIEVYFDRSTPLVVQGRTVSPQGLERGDRISVDAVTSQGRLWARRIELVQNVRDSAGGSYYGGELRGAVSQVDPRSRTILITRGGYSGTRERVYYDERTRVEYRGQVFRPEQLDPGDVIRIQARPLRDGWIAEQIWVEVDARSR